AAIHGPTLRPAAGFHRMVFRRDVRPVRFPGLVLRGNGVLRRAMHCKTETLHFLSRGCGTVLLVHAVWNSLGRVHTRCPDAPDRETTFRSGAAIDGTGLSLACKVTSPSSCTRICRLCGIRNMTGSWRKRG